MKNIFKRKYRVYEIKKGDDTSKFYPQSRMWCWIWRGLPEREGSSSRARFNSLNQANEFICDLHQTERHGKIIGREAHEFNEVFYKLKNTNTNQGDTEDSTDSLRF